MSECVCVCLYHSYTHHCVPLHVRSTVLHTHCDWMRGCFLILEALSGGRSVWAAFGMLSIGKYLEAKEKKRKLVPFSERPCPVTLHSFTYSFTHSLTNSLTHSRSHIIMDRPHIAGLILARGGSAGIPLKNVAPLNGRPLISYALTETLKADCLDSVWVSTDHPVIARHVSAYRSVKVFWRSPRFATSQSPSIEAVQEFLENRPEVDVVALVQCTSPFIREDFLNKACDLILDAQFDSVFSVTRSKKFRWKEVKEDSSTSTSALNFDPTNRTRRQDWPGELVENGMFYFARRHLIEKGLFQGGKCTYVEVPSDLSLEIDSKLDLACAEAILRNKLI